MDKVPQRQKLSLIGGSANIRTGAVQFHDDWPGLFIRGDDAISLMVTIRFLYDRVKDSGDGLAGAAVIRLVQLADVIERDVMVRPSELE